MSKKDRIIKVCVCCLKELDAEKDKDLFVEAEGKVACKAHHGVEKWYKEAKDREEKAMTTLSGVLDEATAPEHP